MTGLMTCDELALTLADYLEGDVDDALRRRIEAHIDSCEACGSLIADLRRLETEASALPELAPERDLWAGIAARIETPVVELKNTNRVARGTSTRWRTVWLGVAAAALVVATATITQQVTSRSMTRAAAANRTQVAAVPEARGVASATLVENRIPGGARYDQEITQLREILNKRRSQLDSTTVAVVEKNLGVIDDAIAQCEQALRRDPSSRYLIESLREELDTKVQLLRTAAALPTRS